MDSVGISTSFSEFQEMVAQVETKPPPDPMGQAGVFVLQPVILNSQFPNNIKGMVEAGGEERPFEQKRSAPSLRRVPCFIELFAKPDLDERLVRHILLVGRAFDCVEQGHGQA